MKTLLIYPPVSPISAAIYAMPLGVCSLKSFLVQNGYEATVLDLNVKTYLDCDHKDLWDDNNRGLWENKDSFFTKVLPKINTNKLLDHILSKDADIIGFSISVSSIFISLFLAKKIKKLSEKKIIFGGPGCNENNLEEYLRKGIDAIILGEGEQTLLEFVQGFQLCRGVYMLQNNQVVFGGARELINIDSLPYPDFDDIINDYRKLTSDIWVSTSFLRGCTNRCAFCDESPYWQKARQRSPENIVNELIFQKSRYKASGFHKGDSTLADSSETLNIICDLIIKRDLNLIWFSQARPVKWLTFELLQKMYQSGCRHLSYGVESGSQKVLDRMNKKLNIKEINRIVKDTKRAGIMVSICLMVDSPKENLIDFIRTIKLVFKLRKYLSFYYVSSAGILTRSDWYRNPSRYGIIGNNPWHTKYYMNNYISAEIKKRILEMMRKRVLRVWKK